MKRILSIICALTLIALSIQAQQDILLSQEYFSRVNKNPASTGNSEDVDIFLHGRILWAGVDNGPKNLVLNVTNYIEKIKSGMGASVSYTNVGVAHHAINAKLLYNYQIDLNDRFLMALGLGAGVNVVSTNYMSSNMDDESERAEVDILNEKNTVVKPDFNVGLEIDNPYWTLGFSVAHLTNREANTYQPGRHLYTYTSFRCIANDKWDLIPNLAYMHQDKANVFDLGLLVFYQRAYWGGVSWRPDIQDQLHQSVLSFSLGFEIKKFRFGYSYDLGLGRDSQLPSNTHEIMLSYGIAKNKK